MQTRARRPGVRGAAAAIAVGAVALGCSPTFNWRETRLDGIVLMFPCRPIAETRTVRMGAAVRSMELHSCSAGDAVFLLAAIDAPDASDVTAVLGAFRAQAATNLAGIATDAGPFTAPGATPNPQSGRVTIAGARPDGRRVVAQAVFFVKGLRLYQATVLGADDASGREAVDTFFGAIRLP
jgi:hypothetical protein